MKIIAIIYILLILITVISTPFKFGEEREPYSPSSWLVNLLIQIPLLYLLTNILTK